MVKSHTRALEVRAAITWRHLGFKSASMALQRSFTMLWTALPYKTRESNLSLPRHNCMSTAPEENTTATAAATTTLFTSVLDTERQRTMESLGNSTPGKPCGLLSLPRELRDMIYLEALLKNGKTIHFTWADRNGQQKLTGPNVQGLFLSCRQVYHELKDMILRDLTVCLDTDKVPANLSLARLPAREAEKIPYRASRTSSRLNTKTLRCIFAINIAQARVFLPRLVYSTCNSRTCANSSLGLTRQSACHG